MPAITRRKKRTTALVSQVSSVPARTQAAYEQLGVTYSTVQSAPRITHILTQSFHKNESKAVARTIEFLRGSDNPDAAKIIAVYDSVLKTYRPLIQFEGYVLAAGLTTERALEIVFSACVKQSDLAAKMLASASQPEVVGNMVKQVRRYGDTSAAKMLLNHTGFLPLPKTQIVNARRDVNIDQSTTTQNIGIGQLNAIDPQMSRIANRFNERLGLEVGLESSATIPAEVMDEALEISKAVDYDDPAVDSTSEGW